MKKILVPFFLLCFIILLSGCLTLDPKISRSRNSSSELEQIFVSGKTTAFEVEELLGESTVKTNHHPKMNLSYLDGSFFRKNTKKNREFLKPYILEYYLEDESRFKNTFLMFDFYYDKVKDEYILNYMWFHEV